ncbi:aldo/keto reductase [Micromonospora sp. NPDC005206]|uniref:aldo/keto reductase n=1 Tax=Micromonospora sp. NPDC005206 TaxID=3157022 RepID=UPI0033B1ED87
MTGTDAAAGPIGRRRLGQDGPEVGELAFGCMALSGLYGPADQAEAERVILTALDRGVTYLDTADSYGDGDNEMLLGRMLRGHREDVVVATKFGIQREGLGRPERIRAALDASLGRLGMEYVDIYYMHRFDPTTPIEESIGALAELVAAGKVRHVGLSEVSAARLRAAHSVHPIAVVQQEYSLLSREPETDLLCAMRELGVGLVAYSPLSRGLLGGALRTEADLAAYDPRRRRYPRFAPENLPKNLALVGRLRSLADQHGLPLPVLALAWVLSRGDDVVPLFGVRSVERLEQNLAAAGVMLDPGLVAELDRAAPVGAARGDRYAPQMATRLDRPPDPT